MLTKRTAIVIMLLCVATCFYGQHQQLFWYSLQSIVPLNAEEGKEALVLIREQTSDSLSSFTDKNDLFSIACEEEENLNALAELLNEAGYYLIDVTIPRLENSYYVRMSKGYQYAILCWSEPEKFQALGVNGIIIGSETKELLNNEQKAVIENNPAFVHKQE